MPDPRYTIDWSPPDLTPALALLGASRARHRADDRADADAEFKQAEAQRDNARADYFANLQGMAQYESSQRHSAEVARQKAETDRKHQIEAGAAMDTLSRAARQSIGLGNMRGQPYGVQFQEGHDLPANVEGPELSPEAEAARQTPRPHETAPGPAPSPAASPDAALPDAPDSAFFSDSGGPQLPPGPQDHTVLPPLIPSGHEKDSGIAGLNVDTVANNAGFADRVRLAQPQHPSEADLLAPSEDHGAPLLAQAAANSLGLQPGPEGKRRIYANYQGQQFEVPEQKDTTPFGPEYDRMYQGLLDSGEFAHPQDAMKLVVAQYKSDQTQQHIADRTASTIEARQGLQQNQFGHDREMGLDRGDKLSEAEKNRIAAMERARVAGNSRVAASAPTLKIDTANRQDIGTLRQGFKEWKNTVNLAVDSQDLLLKHLSGIVGDAQTWIQQHLSGHYGAAELDVLKQAAQGAINEEKEKLDALHESAAESFGPGSGYEQLGGNVNAMVGGAFKQFGYDAPKIYPDATESVVLGSGKRPAAPKAKPQIPAGATMGTLHGKRGYVADGKFVPVE